MTATPKLDTLPNEIIQKIWPLSENPYLPLTSRKLYASLNSEHVKRDFYRKLGMKWLCVLMINKSRLMQEEGITAKLLSEVLERSGVTNSELQVLAASEPGVIGMYYPCVHLWVPWDTKIPRRLWDGKLMVIFNRY